MKDKKKSILPYMVILFAVITVLLFVPIFTDGGSLQSKLICSVTNSALCPGPTTTAITPADPKEIISAFDGKQGACCGFDNHTCGTGLRCRGVITLSGHQSYGVCDTNAAKDSDPVPPPRLEYCGR